MLENTSSRYIINIKDLLTENEAGSRGLFCEMLRSQHIAETMQFYDHVFSCIDRANANANVSEKEDGQNQGQGHVQQTLTKLRQALKLADPGM